MKKYILNHTESKDAVKDYVNKLDDIEHAMVNMTWELHPTQLQLLSQAAEKISEAIELLKQARDTPEVFRPS